MKEIRVIIDNRTAPIHDTTSIRQQAKQVCKGTQRLTAMTSDRFLFNRLYIASQQRDGPETLVSSLCTRTSRTQRIRPSMAIYVILKSLT